MVVKRKVVRKRRRLKKPFRYALNGILGLLMLTLVTKSIDISNVNAYEARTGLGAILLHDFAQVGDSSVEEEIALRMAENIDYNGIEIQPIQVENRYVPLNYVDVQGKIYDKTLAVSSDKILVRSNVNRDPYLELIDKELRLYKGDIWNPATFIKEVSDYSNALPAIKIETNLNPFMEGEYEATYTAVNQEGRSTTKVLKIIVEMHPDAVKANEEAKEKFAQEQVDALEEQLRQEEEQKRLEEERQRIQEEYEAYQEYLANISQNDYSNYVLTGDVSDKGLAIVNEARRWVGVGKYVMGGTNPATGTDCSGFTQYLYNMMGIGINRTAAAQASNGVKVSIENAQPGDLVLWTGHAAIYSGNGYIIGAQNPSSGIKEIPLSSAYGSGAFMGIYHVPAVDN